MARQVATLQDNIRNVDTTVTNRAYWLGGIDTTREALTQYDLLRTGYGRLFILRMPKFVEYLLPDETKKFKHLLEFANVGVDGLQGYTMDFQSLTAGYVGQSIELPVNMKDDTSAITIKIYETQGSLIRTYIEFWMTGTLDPLTGLNHYHGARDIQANNENMIFSQANHTMEALFVSTDPTGEEPEYVAYLTNMFPKSSDHSHFNFEPGSHDLVQMSIEFTCNKYNSHNINYLGVMALKKFHILKNYLNMNPGYYTEQTMDEKFADYKIDNWTSDANGTNRDLTNTYVLRNEVPTYTETKDYPL